MCQTLLKFLPINSAWNYINHVGADWIKVISVLGLNRVHTLSIVVYGDIHSSICAKKKKKRHH